MIVKILLSFLILVIWYLGLVFLYPDVSSRIEDKLGVSWFTETLIRWKNIFDYITTDGVEQNLERFMKTRDALREWIDTTKEKIDTVREQGQKIEAGYNELQENIDTLKWVYDDTSEAIKQVSWSIDTIKKITTSSTGSLTE